MPSDRAPRGIADGGLETVPGELATLRDLGLALPVLVFADAQFGLIELKQRSSTLPNLAVDFGATDFPTVARALGGESAAVRDRASLARELEAALVHDRFTIIGAEIGRRAYDGRGGDAAMLRKPSTKPRRLRSPA